MCIVKYILLFTLLPIVTCSFGTHFQTDRGIFLGVPNYELIIPVNVSEVHTVISVLNDTHQALMNHDFKMIINIQNQECFFEDYGLRKCFNKKNLFMEFSIMA
jgi:hypothetical protein